MPLLPEGERMTSAQHLAVPSAASELPSAFSVLPVRAKLVAPQPPQAPRRSSTSVWQGLMSTSSRFQRPHVQEP